jgi:short-subunit dehydrogenase
MDSFRNRIALVTGAASGIGRATSLELAHRGASLVLADIDAKGLSAVADEARAHGVDARTFVVDVADAAAVESLARDVGPIDLLVNNAGIAVAAPFVHTSARDWERLFGVNVFGPLRLTRAFLPSMIERKNGQIVFVASLAGLVGAPALVAYTTTKFAVVGFAEALRLELAGTGVGVTTVCPGFVRTNFAKSTRYERSPLRAFLDHPPGWYGLSKERVARALVDAVVARRPLVVLGPEKMGWWLKRIAPEAAFTLTSWVVRRAGLGGASAGSV